MINKNKPRYVPLLTFAREHGITEATLRGRIATGKMKKGKDWDWVDVPTKQKMVNTEYKP